MAPNERDVAEALLDNEPHEASVAPKASRKYEIIYFDVFRCLYWHLAGLYGLYLCFTVAKWQTMLLNVVFYLFGLWGIMAGAHRLWAHRAYKAKLPLQILLMLFQSIAVQNPVLHWARDHRLHHKYCDTDADPHNAKRGFFFSHVGWLMVKKHPEVTRRGKTIDVEDMYENPILQFQKKYYVLLAGVLAIALPMAISAYFWNETLSTAYHVSIFRLVASLNATFLVNSAAHMYGYKPYDQNISATQNVAVAFAAQGEGFHNYHHVFPFDYRTSEWGNTYFNWTALLIDFFAWIGWAYDLKQVSPDMIEKRAGKTGDNTDIWGQMKEDDQ